ncbi:MAG: DUF1353 domain-containing protein [Gammaproteobacteria bacterium]|nr:DUF1353 domain-containing protein [Gammaproteobacteria bacterium]
MERIAYKAGYKYQLKIEYVTQIETAPAQAIVTEYIELGSAGRLLIKKGYAWDGPSGPTIDTLNFMRGSLIHDALYQLIREGHLTESQHRELADRILQRVCREDGMSALRSWWVYQGVRFGGNPAVDPANEKKLIWAPAEGG